MYCLGINLITSAQHSGGQEEEEDKQTLEEDIVQTTQLIMILIIVAIKFGILIWIDVKFARWSFPMIVNIGHNWWTVIPASVE